MLIITMQLGDKPVYLDTRFRWHVLGFLLWVLQVVPALLLSSYPSYLFSDGRRPTYLTSLPFLFVGSFGVAQSTSIPFLMFWRVFQSFGASSGASVGAAVIGDIYKLEERGTAMGVFLAVCLAHVLTLFSAHPN
jgi:MFS family permease